MHVLSMNRWFQGRELFCKWDLGLVCPRSPYLRNECQFFDVKTYPIAWQGIIKGNHHI